MIVKFNCIVLYFLEEKLSLDCPPFDESGPADRGEMECEYGDEIEIESALYGRLSTTDCSAGNGTYDSWRYDICPFSLDVTTTVATECDGYQECQFRGYNTGLEDLCIGTHKYILITYNCISKS